MQLLTFKIKHGRDFDRELEKARQIAKFALQTRSRTSKDVKHFGLKSAIANQILRKYSNDLRARRVNKVMLTVPGQAIKTETKLRLIRIACLKFELPYQFRNDFQKVSQIELDNQYAYITVAIQEPIPTKAGKFIGLDLNTTGHCAVLADPQTGKILKLGKRAEHIHKKYKNTRRRLQKMGKYSAARKIRNRESRIIRDLNHKISSRVIQTAAASKCGIKMEDLEGVRSCKHSRSFGYSLNSWSFHQLQKMVEYKAKLRGVTVAYVEPAYTSKTCSRCGLLGYRNGKRFKCPTCGHVEDADVNAAFNIALRPPLVAGVSRSGADRDAPEGSTDTPQMATPPTPVTIEPHAL